MGLRLLLWICTAGHIGLVSASVGSAQDKPEKPGAIDFSRQIRPILSDNCFRCHGPDERERKAKMRLDSREGMLKPFRSGGQPVVPGNSKESGIIRRLVAEDPSERMPPAHTNKEVTPHQIELIKQWIDQGASWSDDWTVVTPKRPALPKVSDAKWPRNGIDYFILVRQDREKLKPSPEADRVILTRRLTLDFTGLPPTPH